MPEVFKSLSDPNLIELLNDGKIGVIPTDTIYGLVCRAADQAAVNRLYSVKRRANKPGTIIAANIDQLVELGIKRSYVKAVEQFWPGAVSVVVPFSDPIGADLRQSRPDIAVRIPDDKQLADLLIKTGALLTSSANQPGDSPAVNIAEAQKIFGDKIDFYVDGGDLSNREGSTIIRIIDDAVEVLRQGSVKIENNGVVK